MTAALHNLVGQRIFGGYAVSRKIGEGGMGAVYIAENIELNKKLAVKILLPEWSTNEQIVERFLAEARAASAINHPNIIDILDAAQLPDGSHYILMEYLEGNSLREVAESWGAMAMDMTLAVMAQVCSALDATHMRGIVHRDLKPANLFVSPRPTNQLFTKVLDFGIAKLNDARLAGNIKTGTHAVAGTPAYMSPEQARATRDADHRSDLYSLGVIMYELLAGTRPYAANSIGELAYQQATTRPRALAEHRPDLPAAWCHIIESCLAAEPQQRPQTARLLAHALVDATPNGKHIATSVAPLLFTNAPRSAETFKYQGDLGIGVAPSEPQRGGAASAELGGANTMAARGGPNPPTPIDTGPASGATGSELAVANTMSAAPESPAPPNTTLSAMASQVSAPMEQPRTKRPAWMLPVVVAAAVAVGGVTYAVVSSTKKPTRSAAAAADDREQTADAAPTPTPPARVSVHIDTTPPGDTVYIDGTKHDQLSPLDVSLEVGKTAKIRAEKTGHVAADQSIDVGIDTRSVNLELTPDVTKVVAQPAPDKTTSHRSRRRHRRKPRKTSRRRASAEPKPPATKSSSGHTTPNTTGPPRKPRRKRDPWVVPDEDGTFGLKKRRP